MAKMSTPRLCSSIPDQNSGSRNRKKATKMRTERLKNNKPETNVTNVEAMACLSLRQVTVLVLHASILYEALRENTQAHTPTLCT